MCWSPAAHSLASGTFTITHTIDLYCLGLQGLHGIQPIRLSILTATAFWEHASPPPPSINHCLQAFRNQNKQLASEKLDRVMNLYGSRGHEVNETGWKRIRGGFSRVPPPLCVLFYSSHLVLLTVCQHKHIWYQALKE